MTIEDFRRILIACAGETDAIACDDFSDIPFEDLGYDSLALMESAARIEQEFGVKVPEEKMSELRTPRDAIELLNDMLLARQ
ncbi:MAG: acyl carrier protein [Streptosporangiaceae bacterium]|nr:acyl carrier protein [Streptosporangiaceae bacterium]